MPRESWTALQPGVVAAMLVAEALQGLGVGMLPEATLGGFQQPLDHGSLGPGIILTKKIAGAIIEEISVGQALIHPIFHHLGRSVVAEEIRDRGGHPSLCTRTSAMPDPLPPQPRSCANPGCR